MKYGSIPARFIYAAALLTALLVVLFALLFDRQKQGSEHECRFWGIVFSQNNANVKSLIRAHLDSLRSLGAQNYDGWGMAFFMNADSTKKLPLITRGEPSAPADPRYCYAREEMASYAASSGIAHVRRGSSGPTSGIPDPHPFRRKCINRNFEFVLAHNGNISTTQLLNLILTIDPAYLELNPPDYFPNYIDSDLYAIYIAEVLDAYMDSTIESCIRTAIIKLDSVLDSIGGEMNFVMSDGSTLWVLHYTLSPASAITAYYSPCRPLSDIWTAASQPLDTLPNNWIEIPNRMLATLRPNERPFLTPIYREMVETPLRGQALRLSARTSPFNKTLLISYRVPADSRVVLAIYDAAGKRVRTIFAGSQRTGEYTASWNGLDDNGRALASGTYFCRLKAGNQETSRKTVFAR